LSAPLWVDFKSTPRDYQKLIRQGFGCLRFTQGAAIRAAALAAKHNINFKTPRGATARAVA
jgi:hypothetical protein